MADSRQKLGPHFKELGGPDWCGGYKFFLVIWRFKFNSEAVLIDVSWKSRLCWEVELILLSHWLTRLDFWRKPELLHPWHFSEYDLCGHASLYLSDLLLTVVTTNCDLFHAATHSLLTSIAPSLLLIWATLCHILGTQTSQLHSPFPAEQPLLLFLSRTVTASVSVLETVFQDLGGGGAYVAGEPHKAWPRLLRIGGPSLV